MVLIGIELKSNSAIFALLRTSDKNIEYIATTVKKLELQNTYASSELRSFRDTFENILRDNQVDVVVIKQRIERGPYAGSAVSFKLECLLQLNEVPRVEFISPKSIAAYCQQNPVEFPDGMPNYQKAAFETAFVYIKRHLGGQ